MPEAELLVTINLIKIEIRQSIIPAKTVIALLRMAKDCCSSNCKRPNCETKSCAINIKGLMIAKFPKDLLIELSIADACQYRCNLSTNQNANIK